MVANPRHTIEALAGEARTLGYLVREAGPYDSSPDELMLDISGNGDLFEAYFRRDGRTGYWRFWYGFRHLGLSGDKYRTLKSFRAIIHVGYMENLP